MPGTLNDVYDPFVSKTNDLVRWFETPLPVDPIEQAACEPVHDVGRVHLCVKLQHLWAEFCEELVGVSALRSPITLSGMALRPPSGVTAQADVDQAANSQHKGQYPPWHRPDFTINVAKRLGLGNYREIQLGLGTGPTLDRLLNVRNYVVHPNAVTEAKYNQVAIDVRAPGLVPMDLLAVRQRGGATLFEVWVADLQGQAQLAAN